MAMRLGWVFVAVALGGCSDSRESANPAAPIVQAPIPPALYQSSAAYGTPAVSYAVTDGSQFDRASAQASAWCMANYGLSARVADDGQAGGTNEGLATFDCVK